MIQAPMFGSLNQCSSLVASKKLSTLPSTVTGDIEAFLVETERRALVAKFENAPAIRCRQGRPLAAPHEVWPQRGDTPLFPILALYTPELPFVPAFLDGHLYWTFFVELDQHEQCVDDGSFVVRCYRELAGLEPLRFPSTLGTKFGDTGFHDTELALRFHEVRDYPSATALKCCLQNRPDLLELYHARSRELTVRYPCHSGIKLGGYPKLIQETYFLKNLDPPFQMQLDCSDYYMYADSGIGYVYSNLAYVIWETL